MWMHINLSQNMQWELASSEKTGIHNLTERWKNLVALNIYVVYFVWQKVWRTRKISTFSHNMHQRCSTSSFTICQYKRPITTEVTYLHLVYGIYKLSLSDKYYSQNDIITTICIIFRANLYWWNEYLTCVLLLHWDLNLAITHFTVVNLIN